MSTPKQWILAFLAVAGAFFLAGLGGSVAADLLGFWHIPGAGFCSALAVVLATYVAAPSSSSRSAALPLWRALYWHG